jgi:hypothetical protein
MWLKMADDVVPKARPMDFSLRPPSTDPTTPRSAPPTDGDIFSSLASQHDLDPKVRVASIS